jgi:exopolysaccharide biosynthesis predicted pyruvyltransferase EpsI
MISFAWYVDLPPSIIVKFSSCVPTHHCPNILQGGGGNFNHLYKDIRRLLTSRLPSLSNLVVVFPHTIRANEDVLPVLPENVLLFCRDRDSYLHVKKYVTTARVEFAYDMAIGFQIPQAIRDFVPTKDVLHGFRKDAERTKLVLPPDNFDVSAIGSMNGGHDAKKVSRITGEKFLRAIAEYRSVMTNRLHAVIGSVLLGRPTMAYDNKYGKVSNVILSSPDFFTDVVQHFGSEEIDLSWPHGMLHR